MLTKPLKFDYNNILCEICASFIYCLEMCQGFLLLLCIIMYCYKYSRPSRIYKSFLLETYAATAARHYSSKVKMLIPRLITPKTQVLWKILAFILAFIFISYNQTSIRTPSIVYQIITDTEHILLNVLLPYHRNEEMG